MKTVLIDMYGLFFINKFGQFVNHIYLNAKNNS